MAEKKQLVKLLHGNTVTLDEFLTWSDHKQYGNLVEQHLSDESRAKLVAARKGKKHTEEAKKKLSIARKGKEGTKGKKVFPIMTPKGLMASRNVAATVYQVSYATISNWEKKRPKEFYRIMGDKTKPA